MHDEQHRVAPIEDLRTAAGIAVLCIRWLAIGPVVFLRNNVGDRFLSTGNIVGALLFLFGYSVFYPGMNPSPAFGWFVLAFIGLCVAHRVNARASEERGLDFHSFSAGHPWLFWYRLGFDGRPALFIDPGLWCLLGLLARQADPRLGAYMLLSGSALYLHEFVLYQRYRQFAKDMRDGRLESQSATELLAKKPVRVASNIARTAKPKD
jgi:hypothetical protein